MARNGETEADAIGRRYGRGPRLCLCGEAKDQLTGVQYRVVQIGVGTGFQRIELLVGDLGVGVVGNYAGRR